MLTKVNGLEFDLPIELPRWVLKQKEYHLKLGDKLVRGYDPWGENNLGTRISPSGGGNNEADAFIYCRTLPKTLEFNFHVESLRYRAAFDKNNTSKAQRIWALPRQVASVAESRNVYDSPELMVDTAKDILSYLTLLSINDCRPNPFLFNPNKIEFCF